MRGTLLTGAAVTALTLALATSAALAADAAGAALTDTPHATVEELVVTASKREQKLFDVANAVNVVSGAQVDDDRLQDARDLIGLVPTAFIQEINAGTARDINIRGVGTPTLFAQPGVALYVDDVYSNGFISYPTQFYDLDRMEVLRGPQGGLYGWNAVGGVVNIISHDATDTFSAYGRASYGTYDRYELEGMVNMPLATGVALRLTGWDTKQTEGEFYNDYLHQYLDANESKGIRAVLNVAPTKDLTVKLVAETEDAHTPGTDLYFPSAGETPTTIMRDTQPTNHYDTSRLVAEINDKTAVGTFTLIGGLRNYVLTGVEDTDLTAIASNKEVTNRTNWVHGDYVEGRWLSPDLGPVSILAGASYIRDKASGVVYTDLAGLSSEIDAPANLNILNNQEVKSAAVFGDVTWKIIRTVSVIVDLRYTSDKNSENFGFIVSPALNAVVPSFYSQALDTTKTFTNFSPGATLAWSPDDNWRAYAKVQTGFRAGGFNFNVGSINDLPYNSETSINYEIGVKHQFSPNLYVATDAFIFDQNHVLVGQYDFTVPAPVASYLANVGTGRTYGVELEAAWRPLPGLSLNANLGWLDAKFTSGTTAFYGSVVGYQLPTSRPLTASLSTDYRYPVTPKLDLIFDGAYIHRASGWFDVANTVYADPVNTLNLRAGVDIDHHVRVSGFVQNLLNDQYEIAYGGYENGAYGIETAPGRTFGIEIKASF